VDADDALGAARAAFADAAARLADAGARSELLAEYHPPRRVALLTRPPVLRGIGRVWRLGVLLLEPDGAVRATGEVLSLADPGHPNHRSAVAERRRQLRLAARRGRLPLGEVVDFAARPIELTRDGLAAPGPLALEEHGVTVRWSPTGGGTVPLAAYLAERVDLLAHPRPGA